MKQLPDPHFFLLGGADQLIICGTRASVVAKSQGAVNAREHKPPTERGVVGSYGYTRSQLKDRTTNGQVSAFNNDKAA
jgi:hypothetical protein